MLIQLEKAERLLSIEASIANLYQKLMDLEKENRKDSYYTLFLERLELAQKYENLLLQDLYSNLGMEKTLKIFNLEEEKKPEDLEFSPEFSISVRLHHLILDYFYADIKPLGEIHSLDDVLIEDVYQLRQKRLLHEKACFAYHHAVFLTFLQLIQKKIQMNFYKDEFTSLKYRLLFSYPFLESQMMMGNMDTLTDSPVLLSFAFRYGLSIKSVKEELREKNEANINIKTVIYDLLFNTQKSNFYLERTYLLLKAQLLHESETTCFYLENFIGDLGVKSEELERVMAVFKEVVMF